MYSDDDGCLRICRGAVVIVNDASDAWILHDAFLFRQRPARCPVGLTGPPDGGKLLGFVPGVVKRPEEVVDRGEQIDLGLPLRAVGVRRALARDEAVPAEREHLRHVGGVEVARVGDRCRAAPTASVAHATIPAAAY